VALTNKEKDKEREREREKIENRIFKKKKMK